MPVHLSAPKVSPAEAFVWVIVGSSLNAGSQTPAQVPDKPLLRPCAACAQRTRHAVQQEDACLDSLRACMKAASVRAPDIGMELYTEARMPPTDRCPFSCTCARKRAPQAPEQITVNSVAPSPGILTFTSPSIGLQGSTALPCNPLGRVEVHDYAL